MNNIYVNWQCPLTDKSAINKTSNWPQLTYVHFFSRVKIARWVYGGINS